MELLARERDLRVASEKKRSDIEYEWETETPVHQRGAQSVAVEMVEFSEIGVAVPVEATRT